MPSYLDSGFDSNMNKIIEGESETSSLDFDALVESISASKISSGIMRSNDNKMSMNLDDASASWGDGLSERVKIGSLGDNEYGLLIKDQNGNVLMKISGKENIIQSANGKMQIDLTDEQARWFGETALQILIGKAKGVF